MSTKILDKPFTLRQMLRWACWSLILVVPIYFWVYLGTAWDLKMGGVSLNHSPFKDQISVECLAYAQRSHGTPGGRTAVDNFLLRERITRVSIVNFIYGPGIFKNCLGQAVITGLHAQVPGEANFTEELLDSNGDVIVTIRVEYSKPYLNTK